MQLDQAMLSSWTKSERWEWFASGDPQVAPRIVPSPLHQNSAGQILFEAGLLFLVPLAMATAIGIALSP